MLFNRFRQSFSERARYHAKCDRVRKLCVENGLPRGDWDLDLLQTLLSLRAIVGKAPETLIDIGAHKGKFTQAAAAILGIRKAVCVEPDSDLTPAISSNNTGIELDVAKVALGQVRGEADFYVHEDRSMNSTLPADPIILNESFSTYRTDQISVRSVRQLQLDDLLTEYQLDDGRRLFIKLDTQGSELNILRSGPRAVLQADVCLVEFMFCTPYATDYSFADLIEFMRDAGLSCAGALSIHRRKSHHVSAVDFLFHRHSKTSPV